MKKSSAFICSLVLFFMACKKDNDVPTSPPPRPMIKKLKGVLLGMTDTIVFDYQYDSKWRIKKILLDSKDHYACQYPTDSTIVGYDYYQIPPQMNINYNPKTGYEKGYDYTTEGYQLGQTGTRYETVIDNGNAIIGDAGQKTTYNDKPNTIGHENEGKFWLGKQSRNLPIYTKKTSVWLDIKEVNYDSYQRVIRTIDSDNWITVYEYY
jgi:hypothetical protein